MFWGRSDRPTYVRRHISNSTRIRAAVEALESRTLLSVTTITVANLNASGTGSLAQAITDANTAGGKTIINFASGLTGNLNLPSPLPVFTADVTLDGPGDTTVTLAGESGTDLGAAAGITAEIENIGVGGNGLDVDNSGNLTISNCDIANTFNGGVINESGGTLTVEDSIVSEINSLDSTSVGITNSGTAAVFDSSVFNVGGDGIDNSGTLAVTNCTITGNNTNGIENSGTLSVTDSTIDLNTTGIAATASFTLNGSVVADNIGDLSLTSTSVSGSKDVIGDGSDGGALTNTQRGTTSDPLDPMLGDLAANGGATPTQALDAGSPAIGNGANFPVMDPSGNDITATDQRGTARPQDGVYDAGAYQTVPNSGVAPQITSAASTSFYSGLPNSFTIVATGTPTATLQVRGVLPPGITFTDNGNGTATLAGTATVPIAGVDSLAFRAKNGISPVDRQSFELGIVLTSPPILSGGTKSTFVVGNDKIVQFTAAGVPTPQITGTGTLPSGVTFTAKNNGSATLEGTPASGTGGIYTLSLKAKNGIAPAVKKTYTLTVAQAAAITSATSTSFAGGAFSSFNVTTIGYPAASITEIGTLPAGLVFKDMGNGTGKLRGTPVAGTAGVYDIKFKATNGFPKVKQLFVLTIQNAAPAAVAAPADEIKEDDIATDGILLSQAGDDTILD